MAFWVSAKLPATSTMLSETGDAGSGGDSAKARTLNAIEPARPATTLRRVGVNVMAVVSLLDVRWARWRLGALWLGLSRPFPEWMAGRCAVQLRLGLLIAARLDEGLVLLVLENLDRLENAAQVNTHRLDRALAVARAEPVDHGGMLGHHGRMLAQ